MRDNWFYGLGLSSSDLGLLKKELRDMGILLWDKRGNDQWNHAIDIWKMNQEIGAIQGCFFHVTSLSVMLKT